MRGAVRVNCTARALPIQSRTLHREKGGALEAEFSPKGSRLANPDEVRVGQERARTKVKICLALAGAPREPVHVCASMCGRIQKRRRRGGTRKGLRGRGPQQAHRARRVPRPDRDGPLHARCTRPGAPSLEPPSPRRSGRSSFCASDFYFPVAVNSALGVPREHAGTRANGPCAAPPRRHRQTASAGRTKNREGEKELAACLVRDRSFVPCAPRGSGV